MSTPEDSLEAGHEVDTEGTVTTFVRRACGRGNPVVRGDPTAAEPNALYGFPGSPRRAPGGAGADAHRGLAVFPTGNDRDQIRQELVEARSDLKTATAVREQ